MFTDLLMLPWIGANIAVENYGIAFFIGAVYLGLKIFTAILEQRRRDEEWEESR